MRLVPYYYFFFVLFAFYFLLLVWEVKGLKSYSKMCLQKSYRATRRECLVWRSVHLELSLSPQTAVVAQAAAREAQSRCLQERTKWPLLHQCLQKEEAHSLKSNSVCCQAGRKVIRCLQLLEFLLSSCTRWQQVFNQFKVHSLYVIIGIVCGNGLTYPSMPKRK